MTSGENENHLLWDPLPQAIMDSVFAKIAENTVKFNLGDEEVKGNKWFSYIKLITCPQKWRVLFEPFYEESSKDVGVVRDERYGPAERNRLDVFFPLSKEAEKPVLFFVHGGGFFSGDKGWSEKVWFGPESVIWGTKVPRSVGPTLATSSHATVLSL
jgi:acetyl esterase/lipase